VAGIVFLVEKREDHLPRATDMPAFCADGHGQNPPVAIRIAFAVWAMPGAADWPV